MLGTRYYSYFYVVNDSWRKREDEFVFIYFHGKCCKEPPEMSNVNSGVKNKI